MSKIICPTCQNVIEDTQSICNFCGCPVTPVSNSALRQQLQTQEKIDFSKIAKIIINAFGIINGILSIVFGIIIGAKGRGDYTILESYGGDAYTGIQNAAADTSNNVQLLLSVVKTSGCFLLIVIGIFIVLFFVNRLLAALDKRSEEK